MNKEYSQVLLLTILNDHKDITDRIHEIYTNDDKHTKIENARHIVNYLSSHVIAEETLMRELKYPTMARENHVLAHYTIQYVCIKNLRKLISGDVTIDFAEIFRQHYITFDKPLEDYARFILFD